MLISCLLLAGAALAEDSTFAGAAAPTEDKFAEPESEIVAELGGSFASGNSYYYTINGSGTGTHRWKRNKLGIVLGLNIGGAVADADADGLLSDAERAGGLQENARRYAGDLRYDRFLSDNDSLYVLAGAFVYPFAGYDLRSHEQLGYSRLIADTEKTTFKAELGADWAQEFYVEGVDPRYANIIAARVLLALTYKFNENVAFGEQIEAYENVINPADLRLLNTAYLSAALGAKLSVKLSHTLIFDNVPVEGYRALDQVSSVALVAKVL